MNINPFKNSSGSFESDLEDFKSPYKLQSKTDIEVMQQKYMKLTKSTYGYIIRTGIVT